MAPLDNATQIRPQLPHSLSGSRENHGPNEESGEQPYCHANATDVGLAQNQVVFLVRMAPVSSRNPV